MPERVLEENFSPYMFTKTRWLSWIQAMNMNSSSKWKEDYRNSPLETTIIDYKHKIHNNTNEIANLVKV